jgi:hypothetical protein
LIAPPKVVTPKGIWFSGYYLEGRYFQKQHYRKQSKTHKCMQLNIDQQKKILFSN